MKSERAKSTRSKPARQAPNRTPPAAFVQPAPSHALPARQAGRALDDNAAIAGLLAGHRRAQRCFAAIAPVLPSTLAQVVRAGPIDGACWTLLAEHSSAAAKLRQLLPDLLAAARMQEAALEEIKVKVLARS